MKISDIFKRKPQPQPQIQQRTESNSLISEVGEEVLAAYYYQRYGNLITQQVLFDGEKTPHELGTPMDFYLEYYSLRARAWEAFIKSDIVQNAIKKYCLWIVGSGLKFQSDPVEMILEEAGIGIDFNKFSQDLETVFRLYAESKNASYSGEVNLHELAVEALKNAILAGDVLCILRFDGKKNNLELIDGYHVQQPIGTDYEAEAIKRGNKIIQGVEVDAKGSHVAYYIVDENLSYKRVLAYGAKTKRRQAWLFYGLRHKIGDVRGMSLLTAVLESTSKMDRYKDAELKKMESNANVVMTIEHGALSTEENPMVGQLAQSIAKDKGVAPETVDKYCEAKATKIAQETSGVVYNMPRDSKLVKHNSNADSQFGNFMGVNIDIVYATLGIPPEVAMDKFGGAYSGSRAALKSWEYKMMVDRALLLTNQFYKPFFDFWFDINVLTGRIQAPGYLTALSNKDIYVIEAYRKCRFIGASVPHIDPSKEVNAERAKLGPVYANVPLTSLEQAAEQLNTGDITQIKKNYDKEKELFGFGDVGDNADDDPDEQGAV